MIYDKWKISILINSLLLELFEMPILLEIISFEFLLDKSSVLMVARLV